MALLHDLEVVRPASLDAALAALAESVASGTPFRPMAGCTDVLVDAHFGKPMPARWLDLWPLRRELGGLRWDDAGLHIGALATYGDALNQPRFCAELPALAQASALVGATQIQARGTFAGNVENGSPAADAVPALMALDAEVELASLRGRRRVPLRSYYAGYRKTVREADELITGLRIPGAELGQKGQWFRKVGTRSYQAITKVGLAAQLTWFGDRMRAPRIVAVSMGPTICRCPGLEAALDGRTLAELDPAMLRAAQATDLKPIGDVRSTEAYRAEVFARLVAEAVRRTHAAAAFA